jgi:uncharacterized membrane protein
MLVWLNSLILMCVAFLPFLTALLGEYGDQQWVVIYAGSLGITRLLLSSVWWYVSGKPNLASIDIDPRTMRAFHIRSWMLPLIFLALIAVAFFSVTAAVYSWLLLIIVDFVLLGALRRSR